MNNFAFYSPTEFVFGKGTESQTAELVKKYKGTKVMIVYGGGSVVRSGLLDKVKNTSMKQVLLMWNWEVSSLILLTRRYTKASNWDAVKIDFLLPVGGGSVIDTAKAIAMGIPYEGDFWDFYMNKVVPEKAIPLGVVLTIPAAGSEGSGNTVITKLDGLKKLSVRTHGLLRPTFAVMNPELTYTLPAWQTACGVTDMMAHIMERYFTNTEDQEVPDRMCEGTLKAIITEALRVMKEPENYGARANLMWAGTIAHNGTCGVGAVEDWASHFMEHEVSAVYDVTHGAGLAVIFPAWLTYMASHNVGKVAQYAHRVWDVPESDDKKAMALEGVTRLKSFFHAIGMPVTFKELGIEHPDIDLLVKKLHENKGEYVGNYVRLNAQATREIYELANQ